MYVYTKVDEYDIIFLSKSYKFGSLNAKNSRKIQPLNYLRFFSKNPEKINHEKKFLPKWKTWLDIRICSTLTAPFYEDIVLNCAFTSPRNRQTCSVIRFKPNAFRYPESAMYTSLDHVGTACRMHLSTSTVISLDAKDGISLALSRIVNDVVVESRVHTEV